MSDSQAASLVEEAEKKLTKFSLFTSKEEIREKARDKLLQAATLYKTTENWLAAARTYKRASELSQQNKSEIDFVEDLTNAGMMFRKANDPAYEETLSTVVDLYDKNGKYGQASKVCQTLAEMGGAASEKWFRRAIQYLRNEGSKVTANELVAKMVQQQVEQGNFELARKEYERLGREYLDEHLTRGSAKKYLFLALLCRIAMLTSTNLLEGIEALAAQFQEYQDLDPQFTELTREHMLVRTILEALENEDEELYTDAYMEYDAIIPLDITKKKMLLRGKQALRGTDKGGRKEADAADDDCR
uniref:Alpha-soluble NSF attachment protein n=1 Tax=Neobodo designis TaxID=312471 RepID=A0A7S1M430_NEODS